MSQKGVGMEERVDIKVEPRERARGIVTGGLGCEGGGGGEDMGEVGKGNRRISEGEQWVYRVGREHSSQKACTKGTSDHFPILRQ